MKHSFICSVFLILSLVLNKSASSEEGTIYLAAASKVFFFDTSQFNNVTSYTLNGHLVSICEKNERYFKTCPAGDLPGYYIKPDSQLTVSLENKIPALNTIYAFNDYIDIFYKESKSPPSVIIENSGTKPRLILSPMKSSLQFIRHDKTWLDKNGREVLSAKVYGNDSVELQLSHKCGFEIVNYKPEYLKIKLKKCDEIKIAIDPGHGGSEIGACTGKLCESNLSYSLAELTKARLDEAKINSFLTREKDETLKIEDRLRRVEASGASLLVSLHFDKWEANNYMKAPSGTGCYYFYRFFSEAAEKICGSSGIKGLGTGQISQRSLYLLQSYSVPSVIVEVANLANLADIKVLSSEEFLPDAANYLSKSISDLVKLKTS